YSLIDRAETSALSPRLKAVAYRDGLMILIQLASGLRVGNLAALRIGYSFVRRGVAWWISFEGHETKNHRPIEMPLPPQLTPLVERYIGSWRRKRLTRAGVYDAAVVPDSELLWLGRYGGRFGPKKIAKRINEVTLRALGHAMNPHLFRKLVP